MTIDEATEILRKIKKKKTLHFGSCHAEGFIEGWNARGEKDAAIVDNYHDITVDDGVYLKREILKLSVTEEEKGK